MDPFTITAAALGIARAAGLTDWIGRKLGGAPGEKASRKIVAIATEAVGGNSPGETIARIQSNPQLEQTLRTQIIKRESELVQLNAEDTKNARAMYDHNPAQANAVAQQIMRWNLPAIVALILANCLAVYYIQNPAVAVAVGNIVGASISFLWQERSQVVGFFFGSSIGSKEKTDLLVR